MYTELTRQQVLSLVAKYPYDIRVLKLINDYNKIGSDIAYYILTMPEWLIRNVEAYNYRDNIVQKLSSQEVISVIKRLLPPSDHFTTAFKKLFNLNKISIEVVNLLITNEYLTKIDRWGLHASINLVIRKGFIEKSITQVDTFTILEKFLHPAIKQFFFWDDIINSIMKESFLGELWIIKHFEQIPLSGYGWLSVTRQIESESQLHSKIIHHSKIIYEVFKRYSYDISQNSVLDTFSYISGFSDILKQEIWSRYNVLCDYVDPDSAKIIIEYAYSTKYSSYTQSQKNFKQKGTINLKNSNRILSWADIFADAIIAYRDGEQDKIVKVITGIGKQINSYTAIFAFVFDVAYELYNKNEDEDYSKVLLSISSSFITMSVITEGLLLISPWSITTLHGFKVAFDWCPVFFDDCSYQNIISNFIDTKSTHETVENILLGQHISFPNEI